MSKPLVLAHRGASAYEYENSLAAFRAAQPRGADGIELDIHATKDGMLFVHHDETINHTHITRSTAKQIGTLHLPNGEPVPTLDDALAAIPAALQVFIEVKSLPPQYDGVLYATLDKGPKGRFAVHSFDHRIVSRLGFARPKMSRGILIAHYPVRPLEELEDTGAHTLWEDQSLIDAGLVDAIHTADCRIFGWTANEAEDIKRLVDLGVDGICTNFPDVARAIVDAAA